MIEVTQQLDIENSQNSVERFESTSVLALIGLSIVFLILIYLASLSSGTSLNDIASMIVFP